MTYPMKGNLEKMIASVQTYDNNSSTDVTRDAPYISQ